MSWFYEYLSLGKWHPAKVPDQPETDAKGGKTCLKSNGGSGREVRSIAEIPADHEKLTLQQLAQVYGRDGKFRSTVARDCGAPAADPWQPVDTAPKGNPADLRGPELLLWCSSMDLPIAGQWAASNEGGDWIAVEDGEEIPDVTHWQHIVGPKEAAS